ncbi:hypothetical protein BG015_005366, partial [Linnemannia schmuckeri]
MSSQYLSPQQHSSYASSISSASVSRPSSPASILLASTTPAPSPPHSPVSFHSKTMNINSPPSSASSPTTSGTSNSSASSSKMNTIVSIVTQFEHQQQQSANSSSSLPPDISANSPNLFSLSTITSLLFYQPITRIVVVLTVLQSLLGLGGKFPEHCSAPSYTLYGGEYLGLLISPFVVPLTPTLLKSAHQTPVIAVMLAISNLISFGLFEKRLTTVFRGNRTKRSNISINRNSTRIFRNLVLVIVVLVMGLRQLLGFIFNRALG